MDDETKVEPAQSTGFTDKPVPVQGEYPERPYEEAMTDDQRAVRRR